MRRKIRVEELSLITINPDGQPDKMVGYALAVIDMGSNAIRMRVFHLTMGQAPREILRRRLPVRLGTGVFSTGALAEDDMVAALRGLQALKEETVAQGWEGPLVVATSAVRDASNRVEFIERVATVAGLSVRVLEGSEEARLAALGAVTGGDDGQALRSGYVIDIGGGSTEVVWLPGGSAMGWSVSLPLGAVRLAGQWGKTADSSTPLQSYRESVASIIRKYLPDGARAAGDAWALGGTPRALSQIAQFLGLAIGDKVSTLMPEAITEMVKSIAESVPSELAAGACLEPSRAELLLPGAIILEGIVAALCLARIHPTDAGLCEGIAWEAAQKLQNYTRDDN